MGGGKAHLEEEGKKPGIFGRWLQRGGVGEETRTPVLSRSGTSMAQEDRLGDKLSFHGKSNQGFGGGVIDSRGLATGRKGEREETGLRPEGDGSKAESSNHQRTGLVELTAVTKTRSDSVPPGFFDHVTRALTEAMGPMAALVVRDQVAALGESLETFPKRRVKELLEVVSQEILDERLKLRFHERMSEEMRTLKSA